LKSDLPDRILVTGGAGYIGSHCCKALADAGCKPVVYDNLSRGHADAVKWGPLVEGDLRDTAGLAETMRAHRIEAVIHFAALAYVGESGIEPLRYYDNNVGGMISLLDAMQMAGVGQIIFSSSCATYGIPRELPIREDAPQAPINPYGRTKLACEWILRDVAQARGLRYAALRYFNAAGADPGGEIGERHDPETHLIPLALMAASGQAGPLKVFGTDYDTPDGTCVRDYIHVSDLAEAHLLALSHLAGGSGNLELNLGTGRGHSVREVIAAVERVTARAVPFEAAPRRPGDPAELTADPSRAGDALGLSPRYTAIEEIVSHAAPWFGHRNAH
jgi:UDP-arabinose 4-epimerase